MAASSFSLWSDEDEGAFFAHFRVFNEMNSYYNVDTRVNASGAICVEN